jgi:hypothetical protein
VGWEGMREDRREKRQVGYEEMGERGVGVERRSR